MARDETTNWLRNARKFHERGDLRRAEQLLTQLSHTAPLTTEAHHRLAQIYLASSRINDAKIAIDRALTQKPGSAAIWKTLIQIARRVGDTQIISKIASGLELAPLPKSDRRKLAKALTAPLPATPYAARPLAELRMQGALTDALTQARAAYQSHPTAKHALDVAQCHRDLHQDDVAQDALKTAVSEYPDHLGLTELLITHLRSTGQTKAATQALENARVKWPKNAPFILMQIITSPKDKGTVAQMERLLDQPNLPDVDRRNLLFAKARNAEGTPDEFNTLDAANALTRDAFPYDIAPDELDVLANQRGFERQFTQDMRPAANPAPRPIFVTGLPRSGTTLAERILGTHPDVASAGEVGWINRHVRKLLQAQTRGPEALKFAQNVTARYWAMQKQRFPNARCIIDKSIPSYAYIGALKLLMPNAQIIVMRRDPTDTALSLYRNMFVDGRHRYANDLKDIARFTRLFEAQLAFWRKATPTSFHEVWYEDLVQRPEVSARKLLSAAGLSWNPACLEFHRSSGRVDTLSADQVRKPIHVNSVGSSESVAAQMAPFTELYDALAPAQKAHS